MHVWGSGYIRHPIRETLTQLWVYLEGARGCRAGRATTACEGGGDLGNYIRSMSTMSDIDRDHAYMAVALLPPLPPPLS